MQPQCPNMRRTAIVVFAMVILAAAALTGAILAQEMSDNELLREAQKNLTPLPKDMASREFPVLPHRVSLGRMLFFDPRFSIDGTMSCVRCHQPALYGADALPQSHGIHDQVAPRNAPTVFNAALQFKIHWDGVFENVEEQAQEVLTGPVFDNRDRAAAIAKIKAIPGYPESFAKAFPEQADPVTPENWAKAVGAYERTLLTPSRFDEFLTGKIDALTAEERHGLRTFLDQGCAQCHNGAGVGGADFQKFGVVGDYWTETRNREIDKGRFNVTKADKDLYVFKVSSLRNVGVTAPYFHDGSVNSLNEAVQVMGKVQLGIELTEKETSAIVAFLNSLTGPIPESFANAPVLPSAGFVPDGDGDKGERR